jgi:ketosteroid isomerase-like protein
MSSENVDTVRRMYAAFHGGDAAAALDHFDGDVVLDATRRLDGGVARGRDALASTIANWVGAFDDWHEHIEELHEVGARVLVVLTQHGRGKGSGIEIHTRYATLFEMGGGKIVHMTLYPDVEEARAAAERA